MKSHLFATLNPLSKRGCRWSGRILLAILPLAGSSLLGETREFFGEVKEGRLSSYVSENVRFSGRLHPQFDYLESELKGTSVADPETAQRDFFRRVFAGVKVDLSRSLRVNYLTDVSDRIVKNQIARLEWKPGDANKIYIGYQKVPFGFEDTMSSSKVKPIERSANTRFWNEVVGIGSYHSGVYYYHDYGQGMDSVLGLAHNVKSESDWPDVLDGDVSLYARFTKEGKSDYGSFYQAGVDVGYQPYGDGRQVLAASFFGNLSYSGYELALEATGGEIGLVEGDAAKAFGWHAQVSRMWGEKWEWVARASQIDTGGYQLKLSSAIRKAPYSGFKYEQVDSIYFGGNYYMKGNSVKFSVGYELAEGRDALSGSGVLDGVSEVVSGFRARGQLLF